MDELPFFLNKSSSPKSWFQLLEAKFDFDIFSSPNKFYQTISCLPEPVLKFLSDDLVQASLSFDHYNSLKDLLIDHYRSQADDIIRSYFQSHPIAEHDKPSEHLSKCARDLESIKPAITKDNEQIVRMFFLSSLPPDVQKIVNGDTNIDLGMLAEFANRMSRASTDNQLTNGSLIIHGCECWPIGRDGRSSLFVNPPSQFGWFNNLSLRFFSFMFRNMSSSERIAVQSPTATARWTIISSQCGNNREFHVRATVSSPQFTVVTAPHLTSVSGASDPNFSDMLNRKKLFEYSKAHIY